MSGSSRSTLQGTLFALAGFAIFSTHDVAVKALGGTYSAFQIVFFSVLMGFPLVTIMLLRDETSANLRPKHPWWTALRTAAAVITGVCAFYAFSVLPLAQTYAILFAAPLLITVLSVPILGETVGWRRGFAVVLGLIGVLVVLRPGTTELNFGHLAAVVAASCGALASVIMRKIGREERTAVMMLYPMVANFFVMGLAMGLYYKPMPIQDLRLVLLIAGFGFLATLCLIMAYRKADAAIVAPMQYSQIIWATLFGWVFFSETVDRATLLGSAIIILSGLFIVLREARGGGSRETPVLRTRSRADTGTGPRVGSMLSTEEKEQGL